MRTGYDLKPIVFIASVVNNMNVMYDEAEWSRQFLAVLATRKPSLPHFMTKRGDVTAAEVRTIRQTMSSTVVELIGKISSVGAAGASAE